MTHTMHTAPATARVSRTFVGLSASRTISGLVAALKRVPSMLDISGGARAERPYGCTASERQAPSPRLQAPSVAPMPFTPNWRLGMDLPAVVETP